MNSTRWTVCALALIAAFLPCALIAQEDVADVTSQDLRAGGDPNKRYFLISPPEGTKTPKDGFGLIVVMPGGDGSADFQAFVKRIYKNSVPDEYLVAQVVAVKWTEKQKIVWPTAKNKVPGMKVSTEGFVGAVIDDVAGKQKLDPRRIFTLSWSSGGPAAYAISLTDKKVTGSFIAMSVFKPSELPPLKNAKGRAYYLYHSREDRVCPFRMPQQAAKELETNGAAVKLATYDGGHGWTGPVFVDIRAGIEWLQNNQPNPLMPSAE